MNTILNVTVFCLVWFPTAVSFKQSVRHSSISSSGGTSGPKAMDTVVLLGKTDGIESAKHYLPRSSIRQRNRPAQFKLRSPFSPRIEALFILPRGTIGLGFKKNCGEILNQCPESPVFNLLKIRLQGIFENFYEGKKKNIWQKFLNTRTGSQYSNKKWTLGDVSDQMENYLRPNGTTEKPR